MVDTVSKQRCREIMSAVWSKNTRPEKVARSFLHKKGLRFRLQPSKMPGKPDLVFPKHKTAVFIHGCFWHAHQNCPGNQVIGFQNPMWNLGKIGFSEIVGGFLLFGNVRSKS
jgi:DNA mismatch endonuclease (patch repair protein)